MAIEEVCRMFQEYVRDSIPDRLIAISKMKVVQQQWVEELYMPCIKAVTERDIEQHTFYPNQRRDKVIRNIVKGTVKYAVLSHRWCREGEVTLQEMASGGTGLEKSSSHYKLANFCQRAAEYGCDFAWADTCCIDRSDASPEELDKTMPRIFRWYRNAHVCIVHLAESFTLDDFLRDSWFLQNWTLQELLAPVRVKFYGQTWSPIHNIRIDNDKADQRLLAALSTGTGIPVQDIQCYWAGTERVREKLMWASRRTSRKVEDDAYSLLALFDVHMHVEYGIGDDAFGRLMKVLLPRSQECDILAWAGIASSKYVFFPPSAHGYGTQYLDGSYNPSHEHYRLHGDQSMTIGGWAAEVEAPDGRVTWSNIRRSKDVLAGRLPRMCSLTKGTTPQCGDKSCLHYFLVTTHLGVHPSWSSGLSIMDGHLMTRRDCWKKGVPIFASSLEQTIQQTSWQKLMTDKVVTIENKDNIRQCLETILM